MSLIRASGVAVVLDETPLSLITQRKGASLDADDCRRWLAELIRAGHRVYVPAIAAYELLRELIRADKTTSLLRLGRFLDAEPDRYIPLDRPTLERAAEMWADARRRGSPTAANHALDGDVILAAQALSLNLSPSEFVVATANVGHLSRYVPARHWRETSANSLEPLPD